MEVFSIDVTYNELMFIRQALDIVTVSGKDAKFLASLQIKVEEEAAQIQQMMLQGEVSKQSQLQQILIDDAVKLNSKKKV